MQQWPGEKSRQPQKPGCTRRQNTTASTNNTHGHLIPPSVQELPGPSEEHQPSPATPRPAGSRGASPMGMLSPFQTAALASSWAPEASLASLSSMWGSAALGVAEAEEAAPPQDGAVHGLVRAAAGRFGKPLQAAGRAPSAFQQGEKKSHQHKPHRCVLMKVPR